MAIVTSVDRNSDEFRANAARMHALAEELQRRRAEAAEGGPARIRERHLARGKLLPRDRVMRLVDPGSPFLELSPLAACGMYDDAIHGAGLITGFSGRGMGEGLSRILADRKWGEEMGARGPGWVKANRDYARLADRVERLFVSLLHAERGKNAYASEAARQPAE